MNLLEDVGEAGRTIGESFATEWRSDDLGDPMSPNNGDWSCKFANEEIGGNVGDEEDGCMNGDSCCSLLPSRRLSDGLELNEKGFWRAEGNGDTGDGGKAEEDDLIVIWWDGGNRGEAENVLEGLAQSLTELLR